MDHSTMEHHFLDDGRVVMVMQGIPGWMFAAAVAGLILFTFVAVERRGLADGEGFRINLSGSRWVHRLLRKRWLQFALQAPVLVLFLLTIYAGLFGEFSHNITPALVWTVWWAALILFVAAAGNLWCLVCPWDALANLLSRLSFWRRKDSLSLGLKLPRWLQNVYPALALFVVLTWLEMGMEITTNPRQTALLGLAMAATAVGMALVFERKAFCRSLCLVGRVSGMYSMFSPVEIRPRDPRVCAVCTTRDCLNGNARGYPCPTGLDLGKLEENTHCTLCTECFKSCPSLAPALRLRPFNRDISRVPAPRTDEAWMALVLLSLTAFHGLSMTPAWKNFGPGTRDMVGAIQGGLGVSELVSFTIGMALVMAAPILIYAAATAAAWLWVRESGVGFRQIFVTYAYTVLPVALFYHLAHNSMHLFMEGPGILPLLSDPLGRGDDWFGTAAMRPGPLLDQQTVWLLQVGLILVGHVAAILASHRVSRRLFQTGAAADRGWAIRSLIPMLVMMIALSAGGLWLMHQSMNMRMGRM